jgi:hypothetical protein
MQLMTTEIERALVNAKPDQPAAQTPIVVK